MGSEIRVGRALIDERAGEPEVAVPVDEGEERAREELLIRQCIEGDREAFRPLVERYSPSLHSFVARYVGSREAARDIVQEAFLRAYRALPDFNPSYRFSTWLYRITLNLCRDHLKRVRSRPADRPAAAAPQEQGVEDHVEARIDRRRQCEAALALMCELPPKYREPLLLKDVERMDYGQMSASTGLGVGLLKIRVMRARRRLADILRRNGIAPFEEGDET
jgi:RNA polymerase sigma-70 factor (ECF subfamily)